MTFKTEIQNSVGYELLLKETQPLPYGYLQQGFSTILEPQKLFEFIHMLTKVKLIQYICFITAKTIL